MNSPTQRTLKKLRDAGYLCAIVEKTIPKCFIKKDLYGFIDILGIMGNKTLAVQTTSNDNATAREQKIRSNENYARVKEAGWSIEVHGWRKLKKGKRYLWECRVIEL
jgi:hypothetical protein